MFFKEIKARGRSSGWLDLVRFRVPALSAFLISASVHLVKRIYGIASVILVFWGRLFDPSRRGLCSHNLSQNSNLTQEDFALARGRSIGPFWLREIDVNRVL